jgi:hypothetical protein
MQTAAMPSISAGPEVGWFTVNPVIERLSKRLFVTVAGFIH